ncbi:MAG: cation:proton antiporter subunit C [Desulfonatronovibrio sp.]|nr:cation:proton antiporter subunit C [Desulfovibrionales bacterium]
MLELIKGHYAYFFLMLLFVIGLYAMMMKKNLMKKIMGMSMVQSATIMVWIVAAFKHGGTVPILDKSIPVDNPDLYINPLPHTLMLTAIVVAVVTLGVSFALVISIYRNFKSLDEPTILKRMK